MQTLELTYDGVKKIKRKLEEGEHVLKIAEEFNISRKVVSKIKSGRSYAWVERYQDWYGQGRMEKCICKGDSKK